MFSTFRICDFELFEKFWCYLLEEKMKKIKKCATLLTIIMVSIGFYKPISARTEDWRDNFRSFFEGSILQKTDEKIKEKEREIQDSQNYQKTKEKVKDSWSKAKNWLGDKWDSYGKHTYTADGFRFDAPDEHINGIYLTIKIGAIRNTMYFSDANGNKTNQDLSWTDVAEIKKYRFITPVTNGKIFTNFAVSYGEDNIFPSGKYYVWAECETLDGSKFYRPAPVSKEKFKSLKSGERGIEFTPDFN